MRVLVFQHVDCEHPGSLRQFLAKDFPQYPIHPLGRPLPKVHHNHQNVEFYHRDVNKQDANQCRPQLKIVSVIQGAHNQHAEKPILA